MKQGTGVNYGDAKKREPRVEAINPGGAEQMGDMVVKNPTPLIAGRGFMAPAPVVDETFPSGSQGKYT